MASLDKEVAVIIDGDNISPAYADAILAEAEKIGDISLANVYVSPNHLKKWEKKENQFQIIITSTSRQATDMTIAFELGDLLSERPDIDIFCLVTNDTDFRVIFRLFKSRRKSIYGFTLKKQGKSLRSGFSNFRILSPPKSNHGERKS